MREYDVLIKAQPEGDVFLYLLTYYANLRVKNSVVINARVRERMIKYISAANQVRLQQRLDGLYKHVFEHIRNQICMASNPRFTAIKSMNRLEPNVIELDLPNKISLFFKQYLGDIELKVGILQSDVDTFKTCVARFDNPIVLGAAVTGTIKHDFERCSLVSNLQVNADNLFYRDPHVSGETSFGICVSASIASVRYRYLYEIDGEDLSALDDMTLEDIDIIVLDD